MKLKFYVMVSMLMLVSACSPPAGMPVQLTLSDLKGLWNSSENKNGLTDLIYTRISSDGSIVEYDFDGDDVDKGLNCYQITSGAVKNLGNNRFLVMADMYENGQFEVELEILDAGHALKIYFQDAKDPAKTLSSQIWTRVADETLLDNEPTCQKTE